MTAAATLRHRIEYALVRGVELALRPLPMRAVRTLGERLGRLASLVAGSRRRIALANLERALPDATPAAREAIVRGMFAHFGRLLVELLRFRHLSSREIVDLVEMEGEQHVTRAYEAGRGLILISGHFGYWEQQGLAHAITWKPIGVMARPLDNPRLHQMLEATRQQTGNAVIYRQGSIRKVLRALAENRAVAILIDQHLHDPEAIHVRFFGRRAATTSVVASLAHRTGAAVIPAFGVPLPGGRYRFIYERPVEPPADDSPEARQDFTQRCTDVIERYIRQYPDLWLWMHRRWRDAKDSEQAASPLPATGAREEPHG